MKVKDKVVNLIKKKSVYLLFLVPIAAIFGCGRGGRYYEDMHDPAELDEAIEEEFGVENKGNNIDSDDVVYVCTGPSAECYHVDRDCWGLGNCSGEIEEMSVSSADEYYRPCSICSK